MRILIIFIFSICVFVGSVFAGNLDKQLIETKIDSTHVFSNDGQKYNCYYQKEEGICIYWQSKDSAVILADSDLDGLVDIGVKIGEGFKGDTVVNVLGIMSINITTFFSDKVLEELPSKDDLRQQFLSEDPEAAALMTVLLGEDFMDLFLDINSKDESSWQAEYDRVLELLQKSLRQ